MIRLFAAALAFLLAGSLAAQASPKGSGKTDERAQAMREQIGAGKQLQSHVRIAVRLKNGNRLKGVVKDGKLVERVDGLLFVDAQATDPNAGIRLWYSGGGRNYVFVPFADLAEYQILQRLTQKQLEQVELELQMDETKRAEQLRLATAERAAAAGAAGETDASVPAVPGAEPASQEPGKPAAPAKYETPERRAARKAKARAEAEAAAAAEAKIANGAESAQQKAWYALLQEYPPAEGWSQQKSQEIARRKAVVGAVPTEKEQRFVEKFAEWKKACEHFGVKAEAKVDSPDGAAPAAEAPVETGSRRDRKKA